jgi:hypothetical protein
MSRHSFTTKYQGQPVEIIAGWDRPFQAYFLLIQFLEVTEEIYLYNDSLDDRAEPKNWLFFEQKLIDFGLYVPVAMAQAVVDDGQTNAGNKNIQYDALGNVIF